MFGPGVSTRPRQTRAKPSRAEVWGMAEPVRETARF
jgi:hypothetical protein